MNFWRHVCTDICKKTIYAHLFFQRRDRFWRSRCNKVLITGNFLTQTEPIANTFAKCKKCIPFEIRRSSVKLRKSN